MSPSDLPSTERSVAVPKLLLSAQSVKQLPARTNAAHLRCPFKQTAGSSDCSFVSAVRGLRARPPRRDSQLPVPFDLRERQNVARLLRRSRLNNFVGTVMLVILFVCGACALSLVVRLSNDPSIVKPW